MFIDLYNLCRLKLIYPKTQSLSLEELCPTTSDKSVKTVSYHRHTPITWSLSLIKHIRKHTFYRINTYIYRNIIHRYINIIYLQKTEAGEFGILECFSFNRYLISMFYKGRWKDIFCCKGIQDYKRRCRRYHGCYFGVAIFIRKCLTKLENV